MEDTTILSISGKDYNVLSYRYTLNNEVNEQVTDEVYGGIVDLVVNFSYDDLQTMINNRFNAIFGNLAISENKGSFREILSFTDAYIINLSEEIQKGGQSQTLSFRIMAGRLKVCQTDCGELRSNVSADKITILYVDDEVNNLSSFKATFRMQYKILLASSGEEALKILETERVHVILTDQRMPGMTGAKFLEQAVAKFPDPVRILITGYSDMSAIIDAVNKGKIFHHLSKPWDVKELEEVISISYEKYLEKVRITSMLGKLTDLNKQLEFLLRQSLLS
jgi:CheY-like chemotaxis protein